MFWNVERFKGDQDRTEDVAKHIRDLDPDVFCLCEVQDKAALRNLLMDTFTDYDFSVTDGRQGIELMTGWRRGMFDQFLFTQRREFKAGSENLRPGALSSIRVNGEYLNVLFLHTDSGTAFSDYRNRLDMYDKIWSLKSTLDGITPGGNARLLVMADANTMGKRASGNFPAVTAEEEITELNRDAQQVGMQLLDKSHDITLAWKRHPNEPDYRLSNLDHVIASDNLTFAPLQPPTGQSAPVRVDGWVHLNGADRENFIEEISDHCSILVDVS